MASTLVNLSVCYLYILKLCIHWKINLNINKTVKSKNREQNTKLIKIGVDNELFSNPAWQIDSWKIMWKNNTKCKHMNIHIIKDTMS